MTDLTIATLCQVLANITSNRCTFVENSNICRCIDNLMGSKPITSVTSAPNIMLSEVFLIFFVLALWLSAIGFCLNQYKSLRRLETQVHYCGNRKDPLNIGNIKIVEREQDSIIYKKKRYSTVLDTHINPEDLRSMQYVREYLPQPIITPKIPSSAVTALVFSREDLTTSIPLAITTPPPTIIPFMNQLPILPLTPHTLLSTHDELAEEQQSPVEPTPSCMSFLPVETKPNKLNGRMSFAHITGRGRITTGLAVPRTSSPSSLRLSWNNSFTYDTSRSAQHLSVPSNSLRLNRYSDGNIAFPNPETSQNVSENQDEQLLDPRLISKTVRRSLLALHRESQENINIQRSKEKTQSENDVHSAFTTWKIKMKSKLKRTHHRQTQPVDCPVHSMSSTPDNNNEYHRRVSEYKTMKQEYRFSTPPSRCYSLSRNPSVRRSLKHYQKYSTQSTTESEPTQGDSSQMTSIPISTNDNKSTKTIDEIDGESTVISS
ncbi:hypothetical protein I4U23_010031 [Adineta vaga]|nr:hypothetical protein I4U23_010031 [Adineta vaga]